MKFEYYVLNYDWNHHKVEHFNIFRNSRVSEWTEKAIKKYIRSPKKYKYVTQYANEFLGREEVAIYGFDALCAELRSILMNQLWSRREYEISVSDAFTYEVSDIADALDDYDNLDELKEDIKKIANKNPKLEKWDAFWQCDLNIPMIARECIYQYKAQMKEKKNEIN